MKPIRLSRKAAAFVCRESAFLKDHSPAAARSYLQVMRQARQLLQDFPDAGNTQHGLQIAGFRTLVVGD